MMHVAEYNDLRYMLGKSVAVARLYSMAKCVMVDKRRSMAPDMFERIMYLNPNPRFWNSRTVLQVQLPQMMLHHLIWRDTR
ncbi:hypothetical protein PHMEG_00014818 [Phytophthora megakarya]|uniref:Uncharacterized protein n=1 Tax=Phytophthora megakarya TaxID=4795 RepID=A0A225W5C1_9STRA|nr:hypothetical protein PHMEG_00014818 [Phytophthora megakarya]